jgi:hypothetical protein
VRYELSASADSGTALGGSVEARTYPVLSGAFLVALAAALVLATWAAGTENYPYIHRPVVYRFPLATLDRVYLTALVVLALHYAAYVAHYLMVGSRQKVGPPPALTFSPAKFVITWFLLIGLAGAYAVGASIATPALFDAVFGPARDTAFVRVWNHTYFGFVLLASLLAAIVYQSAAGARRNGIAGTLGWVGELFSLRAGHRFLGVLNWILLLALLSNFTTGFFILGSAPLLAFPRLPLHAYASENWARLAHDVGTAFIVASFSGQIYLRLLPGNQWMLKTMFAGYETEA